MASLNSMKRGTQPPQPSALDRLKLLEFRFTNLVKQSEDVLNDHNRRISELTSVVNAAVRLLGPETIEAQVKADFIARQEAKADQEQQYVADQVTAGHLVEVESISGDKPSTLVVTKETGADGQEHYPSRNFVPFAAFGNLVQDVLKGAKKGDIITFPVVPEGQEAPEGYEPGTTLEILAAYDVVEPKAEEAPADDVKKSEPGAQTSGEGVDPDPQPESAPVPEVAGSSETAGS